MNTRVSHIITEISESEIVMLLPCSLATGDPGDPLSNTVIQLIKGMATAGYAPVDFGISNDNCIELWFMVVPPDAAVEVADQFIENGGV